MKRATEITDEEFVEAVMRHRSCRKVAVHFGVSEAYVSVKASYLRSIGVKLPLFRPQKAKRSDAKKLNGLIESFELKDKG